MPWHDIGQTTPTDGQTVVIDRGECSAYIQATWTAATAIYTLADGRTLPWYETDRWHSI